MTKRELVIAAFEAMRDDYPALTTTLGTVEKTLEVLCGVAAAELRGSAAAGHRQAQGENHCRPEGPESPNRRVCGHSGGKKGALCGLQGTERGAEAVGREFSRVSKLTQKQGEKMKKRFGKNRKCRW